MPCAGGVAKWVLGVAGAGAVETGAGASGVGRTGAGGFRVEERPGRCAPSVADTRPRSAHPVAASLRRQGLRTKGARKFKATTNANHTLPAAENRLQQDFSAQRPNQIWVGDMTYIGTDEGWLYLAVVLDLYSRKVVGWSMSERMTATLVCDAMRCAWRYSGGTDRAVW